MISVSRSEYDKLVEIARQHENLRQSLLRGGVDEGALQMLSGDAAKEPSHQDSDDTHSQGSACPLSSTTDPASPTSILARGTNDKRGQRRDQQHQRQQQPLQLDRSGSSARAEKTPSKSAPGGPDAERSAGQGPNHKGPRIARAATRTIQLYNLPNGIAHADITKIVRGGMVVDIFIRHKDRTANVSFLFEEDAAKFFDFVRKRDIYVGLKRVCIRWADRQFTLSPHVAHRISGGATRNLVIRRWNGRANAETLRRDLEHIHNLVIVKVTFSGGGCFISTNAVHVAMFARTCMSSQKRYKGLDFSWDVDECAQTIESAYPQEPRLGPAVLKPAQPPPWAANRFRPLEVEGEDDDGDDYNKSS